jgi:hypothetical protein
MAVISIACAVIVPISLFVLFALSAQGAYVRLPFRDLLLLASIVFLIFTVPGLILGLPAVLLLRKFACLRWWSLFAVVFACGAICAGFEIYFGLFDSADAAAHFWDSATVVSRYGVPTRDGWLFLIRRSSFTGVVGAFIAMCGWIPWTILQRSHNRVARRAAAPGI